MYCQVCSKVEKRYKCPKCLTPYCSVICWNTHKNECKGNISVSLPNESPQYSYNYITKSTVSKDKLQLLGESEKLKDILRNPHVRDLLLAVDRSNNPTEDMERAMHEPIFTEFADACLKIVEPQNEQ